MNCEQEPIHAHQFKRVRALPCFDLNELAGNLEALCLRELREGVALRLNAEPGTALP